MLLNMLTRLQFNSARLRSRASKLLNKSYTNYRLALSKLTEFPKLPEADVLSSSDPERLVCHHECPGPSFHKTLRARVLRGQK